MGQLRAAIIPVTAFQQNCTVVFDADTKRGVIVDPGGDVPAIIEFLKEQQITLEAIWLTHGHLDHAGGAKELKQLLGVDIIGPHRDDEILLNNIELSAQNYGLDEKMQNVLPDRWLEEGDMVSFGDHSFSILHCPGHAPGHVVFFNEANRFALVGDVLFNGSVGRTDLPGGDHDALLRSIKEKLLPLGDDVGFICGHGPGSKIGDERRSNPFLVGL